MRPDRRSAEAQAYRRLYKTALWKATRDRQLTEHPLCQSCLKRSRNTPATVCNHINPDQKLDPATFFDGPFSSLCPPCHDAGQQKEERAGYSGACDATGWPADPRHPNAP